MIAKAYKLKGFRACLDYDISKEKGRVIKSNMEGEDPQSLAKEFAVIRQLKPKVSNAVLHVSLSASIGEKLSDDEWVRIGERYLDGMGYTNNQFVMTRHHDTEHEHIHIVANRISLDGQVVSDSQDYKRQTSLMREIEKDFGLNVVSSTSEKKSLKKSEVEKSIRTGEPNMRLILQKIALEAIKRSDTIESYASRLKTQGIEVIAILQKGGEKLVGLVYQKDDFKFKASDLGSAFTVKGLLQKGLIYEQNGYFEPSDRSGNRGSETTQFSQRLRDVREHIGDDRRSDGKVIEGNGTAGQTFSDSRKEDGATYQRILEEEREADNRYKKRDSSLNESSGIDGTREEKARLFKHSDPNRNDFELIAQRISHLAATEQRGDGRKSLSKNDSAEQRDRENSGSDEETNTNNKKEIKKDTELEI